MYSLIRFFLPVAFLTILIMTGFLIRSLWLKTKLRNAIAAKLRKVEERYQDFLTNKRVLQELSGKPDEFLPSDLRAEVLIHLHPSLSSLLGLLEETPFTLLPTDIPSELFPHMMVSYRSIARESAAAQFLDEHDRERFRAAFAEAIEADLSRRFLQFQTGASL